MRILITLLAILTLAASPAPRKPASAVSPAPPRPTSGIPSIAPPGAATAAFGVWTVHTTNVDAKGNGDFSVPNRLTILRPGGDASADRATGNYKTKRMTLYGNVVVHDTQGAFDVASGANRNHAPSTLTTDRLEIDDIAKVYVATGNVRYSQADSNGVADKATMNDLGHTLLLEGNVRVSQTDRQMSADRILYNTATGDAHATGKDVIMTFPAGQGPHLATPRPIHLPFTHHNTTAPTSSPSAAPSAVPR
jgi:lipopolysaccharide export system protein LptA